jgi:ribosomal protein L20A (L18A)
MEKSYVVMGEVRMKMGCDKFKKKVEAVTKERAIEKALSNIGGCHKVKRYQIKILSVEELPVKEQ